MNSKRFRFGERFQKTRFGVFSILKLFRVVAEIMKINDEENKFHDVKKRGFISSELYIYNHGYLLKLKTQEKNDFVECIAKCSTPKLIPQKLKF